jgi:peroxiredoxin Q/BCP
MAQATATAEILGGHEVIEFDELHRRVDDGDTSCVLLNVLPRAAFEAGRIPSSVNLPLAELAEHASNFLPALGQETVVYCASPSCMLARQAAVILRTIGYTNVREYLGGMEEWSERRGRIERASERRREAPAPARTGGMLAKLSPVAAFEWASSQPLPILFAVWLGTCALFALIYWVAGSTAAALTSGGARLPRDFASLVSAFGFSIATAMSSGYGDVLAAGWMRVVVLAETGAGLILFTALISKILGSQQEKVLAEVHRLTYENRLARLRTNLHFLLTELAEISGQCSDPTVPRRRLTSRIESVAAIFAGELQAVRDFVYGNLAEDHGALDGIFACLAAGLEDLADLLTCLPEGRERSADLKRSLRVVAQTGGDLCSTCVIGVRPATMLRNMDRVHRVCGALSDELRAGDLAPAFSLPGSDGDTHQLGDHKGQPVVLLWFPKAFTGGCTAELKSFAPTAAELEEHNVACYAASLDTPELNRAFAEWTGSAIPILSDVSGDVARAYGVIDDGRELPARWTFFIGGDGRIAAIDRDVSPTSHGGDIMVRLRELGLVSVGAGFSRHTAG